MVRESPNARVLDATIARKEKKTALNLRRLDMRHSPSGRAPLTCRSIPSPSGSLFSRQARGSRSGNAGECRRQDAREYVIDYPFVCNARHRLGPHELCCPDCNTPGEMLGI